MEKRTSNEDNRKLVVQALITRIEDKNKESEIRTSLVEGYKKPVKIVEEGENRKGYVPDITSKADDQIDLYEIELDPEKDGLVDKWRLFSIYTDETQGNLNIVTPKNKLDQIKGLLKENQIRARIIYFA